MSDTHERRVSRRSALQGLAGTLGLGVAATGEAAEPHPLEAHIAQRPRTRSAATKTPAPAPEFLDAHQFATLTTIADLIIPGAVASESPRFIDHVLAVERPETQLRFVGALGAFDAAARERHQQPFIRLSAPQQSTLLETAASDQLAHLKGWVSGAHYSSEAGMKELGYTGALFFTTFTDACTHADGHE